MRPSATTRRSDQEHREGPIRAESEGDLQDPGTSARPVEGDPGALEGLASRWIEAWNWRETEALIELADPAIELHPLRLRGVAQNYAGHEGVRAWMDAITAEGHEHRIAPAKVGAVGGGRVLVEGTVSIGGRITSPFSAIYDFGGGRMTSMAHYFTPLALLERIGVLEPGAGL